MKTKHYYLFLTLLILVFSQNSFSQDTELSNRLMSQINEITNLTNKSVGLNKPITRNCITSILLEAKKNWDKLTPQAKSLFSIYTVRPTLVSEQIGCSTNFCFHYTLSGADAVNSLDANSNGFPDYVEQMAGVFENVWTQYQTRNYTMPPLDGTAGGSTKYDVYNNTGSDISACYAYYNNEDRCWTSVGWYTVPPYSNKTIDIGNYSGNIYIRGRQGLATEWGSGDGQFCVDATQAFNIKFADTKDCWSKKKFSKYFVNSGVNKWTFN